MWDCVALTGGADSFLQQEGLPMPSREHYPERCFRGSLSTNEVHLHGSRAVAGLFSGCAWHT